MSRYKTKKPPADVAAMERCLVICIAVGIVLELITKTFGTGWPICSFSGLVTGFVLGYVIKRRVRRKMDMDSDPRRSEKR